jgi:hypothetical protein
VACVTCHVEGRVTDRIALVEGVIRFDFKEWLQCEGEGPGAAVEAGRFIVPFGAIAAQSHPGAQRLVTKPLIFNMGQNVFRPDIGPAVLPMPYSDEGVVAQVSVPLCFCELAVNIHGYVVNGLIGGFDGLNYYLSRDYMDNNSQPAGGGRATVGNQYLQLGGSYMYGRFNDHTGVDPFDRGQYYEIAGVDLTARYEDLIRFQAEYAYRTSDRFVQVPNKFFEDEEVFGYSLEGEVRLCKEPRVGLLARYDTISHHGDMPPSGSTLLEPRFNVHRFTWGFTFNLPGGSVLLLNHEYWSMPDELGNVNVYGARWVATF